MALSRDQFGDRSGKPDCGPDAAAPDAKLAKVAPTIEEFMRTTVWDDESVRTTGSLLFFCEDGRWKVMVNDRDADQVAFVTGESFEGAIKAAEKGLTNGTLDWRMSKQKKGKGR